MRTTDIHRKKIDYMRFTRGYEGNTSYFYLNGKKINPLDLPLIVERIYERRALRHQFGKSSQLDEDVIFTILDVRILDIEFPTQLDPSIQKYGTPKFVLKTTNVPTMVSSSSFKRRNAIYKVGVRKR